MEKQNTTAAKASIYRHAAGIMDAAARLHDTTAEVMTVECEDGTTVYELCQIELALMENAKALCKAADNLK